MRNEFSSRQGQRSARESFTTVVRTVDKFINMGMCWTCAFIAAAEDTGVHKARVEEIWTARQVEHLPNKLF